jgi:hypothetical protein
VDWLENSVRDHYVSGLPLPHIYPSPDGQIVFEWMINSRSASLEIDPGDTSGYWHVLDLKRRSDSTDEDLELGNAAGWKRLAELLASIREGEASDR